MSLQDVLNKAKLESANKPPLPGVKECIDNLEHEATTKIFQPRVKINPDHKVIVAVGGRLDGQDFLNVDGIK